MEMADGNHIPRDALLSSSSYLLTSWQALLYVLSRVITFAHFWSPCSISFSVRKALLCPCCRCRNAGRTGAGQGLPVSYKWPCFDVFSLVWQVCPVFSTRWPPLWTTTVVATRWYLALTFVSLCPTQGTTLIRNHEKSRSCSYQYCR